MVVESVRKVRESEQRAHDIEYDLLRNHVGQDTQSSVEQISGIEPQTERLESERDEALAEIARLRDELNRTTAGTTEVVVTEMHREVLMRALKEAQREVIIISAWLNRRAVDKELCEAVRDALRRNVRIRIAYGIGTAAYPDDEQSRYRNEAAIAQLRKYAGHKQGALQIVHAGGTHEKILVCDRSFCVVGGFNLLSYRGERDAGYRRESSVLMRNPADVAMWADRALEVFPSGGDVSS